MSCLFCFCSCSLTEMSLDCLINYSNVLEGSFLCLSTPPTPQFLHPIFRRSPSIFRYLFLRFRPRQALTALAGRLLVCVRMTCSAAQTHHPTRRLQCCLHQSIKETEINDANDVCSTGLMKAGLASPSTNQIQDQHSTCTASSVAVVTPETRCCNKNDYYCSVFCCCLSGQALAEL